MDKMQLPTSFIHNEKKKNSTKKSMTKFYLQLTRLLNLENNNNISNKPIHFVLLENTFYFYTNENTKRKNSLRRNVVCLKNDRKSE